MAEDAAPPLHHQIRTELEDNILSGRWPPGTKIPSELELSQQYNCARMTVNKAVTELARAGLIGRRRKAGSVVLPQRSQNAILEIFDVRDEVLATGQLYRFALLAREERAATAAERKATGLAAGQKVIALRGLHWAGNRPFCLEERIINPRVVPGARTEGFAHLPPGPWLVEHIPWTEAEHHITAELAGADRAADLEIGAGAPCLVVERATWKLGEPVTRVRFCYPGAAHVLAARFTPRGAPEAG